MRWAGAGEVQVEEGFRSLLFQAEWTLPAPGTFPSSGVNLGQPGGWGGRWDSPFSREGPADLKGSGPGEALPGASE